MVPRTARNILHCVSSDGKMSAGFARDVPAIHKQRFRAVPAHSRCIGQVVATTDEGTTYFHAITKKLARHKPTVDSLRWALRNLPRDEYVCPLIGAGLDQLSPLDTLAAMADTDSIYHVCVIDQERYEICKELAIECEVCVNLEDGQICPALLDKFT